LGNVLPSDLERFGQGFGERKLTCNGTDGAILKEPEERL
jgi:hypothetical protein